MLSQTKQATAQMSGVGELPKAAAQHMSTTHYHVLGSARHLLKNETLLPYQEGCSARKEPPSHNLTHTCHLDAGGIHKMLTSRGDADISVPRDDLQTLGESPSNPLERRSREQDSQVSLMTQKVSSPDLSYI